MGATIINEKDPANGSTVENKNITEIGSTKSLDIMPIGDKNIDIMPIGDNNTKNDSTQNTARPKNFCSINQNCMNLPPEIVEDLQNTEFCFNDVKRIASLIKVLEADEAYESLPITDCTGLIISKLDGLFKQWLKYEERKRAGSEINQIGQNKRKTSKSSPLVLAYGSYQLGVQDKNSDLDLLCIAPEFITREDWITNFYAMLRSKNELRDVEAIPSASIPIIQLKFYGIEIELAFVQLKIKNIPISLDLEKDSSLEGLDQESHRTLNAWRTTYAILEMVPNVNQFKLALRAIRLWAKRNGLYGNKLGYLGGISWAILVAKACLLYPKLDATGIIHKFFFIYANWQWPKRVYLVDPDKPKGKNYYPTGSYNLYEQTNVMPIMTPTYPQENSAYNVTVGSMDTMSAAFYYAYYEVDDIMWGKDTEFNRAWKRFFEAPSFFDRFDHFIVIFAHSSKGAEHVKWQKHIEFKLVNFLRVLERNPNGILPCINTETYRPIDLEDGTDCSIWFIGLCNSPLVYEENKDDDGVLSEETQRDIDIFIGLSTVQALKYEFGTVDLQIKYMNLRECVPIIEKDLEIRRRR